jgi:hypothetical protein
MDMPGFIPFPKIARLNRDIVITEKIDGTNGVLFIPDAIEATMYPDPLYVGSRNRWVLPGRGDNMGFGAWAYLHAQKLIELLGPGYHYGEWWGRGIQRGYDQEFKRFSLFNPFRYQVPLDGLFSVVPVLYEGPFDSHTIGHVLADLRMGGSVAAPGFENPEGVVVYHTASKATFKVTIEGDEKPKGGGE